MTWLSVLNTTKAIPFKGHRVYEAVAWNESRASYPGRSIQAAKIDQGKTQVRSRNVWKSAEVIVGEHHH